MAKFNYLKDCFAYHVKFLTFLGLWYDETKLVGRIRKALITLYWSVYTAAMFLCLCRIRDINLFVRVGSLSVTMANGCLKFLCFDLTKTQSIYNYLDEPVFQPRDEFEIKILKSCKKLMETIISIYEFFVLPAVFFFALSANLEHDYIPGIWLPYLTENCYNVMFVFNSISMFFLGTMCMTFDCVVAGFMAQIGAQCDILSYRVENLIDENHSMSEQESYDALKRCIMHHKLILSLTDEFGGAFHNIVLAQFTDSVLVYCQTMYMLSNTPFGVEFLGHFFYTICIFFEPFLICWFGNDMTSKSELVAGKVYCCRWYLASKRFKYCLLQFMHSLQKPIIIYVGKLFPATLVVWITITKSAWSYYLMLMRMNQRE